MARLFGTDGIRGVANVDLKPTPRLRPRPRDRARARGRRRAARRRPGHASIGRHVRRGDRRRRDDARQRGPRRRRRARRRRSRSWPAQPEFAAGIMVSASHNPADDNGLKVLDARRAQARRHGRGRARGADLARRGAGRPAERGARPGRRRRRAARSLPRPPARARRSAIDAPIRVVLDCANGSGGVVAAEILRATGASVEVIHNEPDGVNINLECGATDPAHWPRAVGGAGRGRRFRARRRRRPAASPSTSTARSSTATSCSASSRSSGSARGALPRRRARGHGALERRPRAGGRGGRRASSIRTPVGDKYILEGMLVSGAMLGGEKSGHVIVIEHTHERRRDRDRARGAARHVRRADEPRRAGRGRSRCFPQQQRAVHVRHKDQWEADPALRACDPARGGAPRRRGRILVRPSGTEPALRIMVEGPDAALVAELADSLAALAGERLH